MNEDRDATEDAGRNAKRKETTIWSYHEIYAPAALAKAVQEFKRSARCESNNPDAFSDDDSWKFPPETSSFTSEDANRFRALERITMDPRGHRRLSIVGTQGMIRRIEALSASMPHFAPVIDLVYRSALVSARTMTPLRLPPILILGEPGIGKTYMLQHLAKAIGAEVSLIAANLTDSFRLRGLNTAWRGARMGRVAEILLGSSTTPIVLVDEFDKMVGDKAERPFDIWHSLLERENAKGFKDDFLEFELRADQILWFASANDLSTFPSSILDRLLILEIPSPGCEQLRIIIASIYAACREAYGDLLPERLSDNASSALLRFNPRQISRLLDLAVGYAAASGRRRLSADDIRCANRLADTRRSDRTSFRGPIGFMQSQIP